MSTLQVRVWRGSEEGHFQDFEVPRAESQTVLDVVTLHPAQARSDALLSLRVPRRHVRLVRDDGQRQGALDLPHARRRSLAKTARSRSVRLHNLPVVKDLVTDMAPVLRQVGAAKGQFQRHAHAQGRFRARAARFAPSASCVDAGDRVHRLRRVLQLVRRRRVEARLPRAGRAQPRVDARQRCARRRASASACAPSRATPAATPATRT